MAHKRFLKPVFTFLALALIIALILLACSNPAGTDVTAGSLSEKYTGVKGSKTCELTITQSASNAQVKAKVFTRAAFTPAEGDSYVLKITENGAVQISSGIVKTFSGNKFTLTASNNVSVSFEVKISGSGITNISGTITIQSGTTITGPGEITPGNTIGNGNSSIGNGNSSVGNGSGNGNGNGNNGNGNNGNGNNGNGNNGNGNNGNGNNGNPNPLPYVNNFSIYPQEAGILFVWAYVPGAEAYYLQWSTSPSDFSPNSSIVVRANSQTINNLQINTKYYCRICAMRNTVSPDDNAIYSYASVTTCPFAPTVAPTDLTATAVSSSKIRLSWSAPPIDTYWTDGDNFNELRYYVYRSSAGPSGSYHLKAPEIRQTSWEDNDVTENTPYWYIIGAFYYCWRSQNGSYEAYGVGSGTQYTSSPVSVTTLP